MKEFNIVITGIGGQGVLTLGSIIAEAASRQGYDVKTSELHGLAQRGGTIPCHIRFGDKIYSSLVREGEANLIIGLEQLEALRACYYGSKENKTVFLMDSYRVVPLSVAILGENYPSQEEVVRIAEQFSEKVVVLNASEAVKKETGSTVAANVYILGYLSSQGLIPIKREILLEGIKKVVPARHLEMNQKAFELGSQAKK